MKRVFNFSAGPSALPQAVLEQARDELLCLGDTGVSVLELGHRTAQFRQMLEQITQNFRELLNIPAHYRVLFLGGSARLQFAMIPLNILRGKTQADYVDTGYWSQVAIQEASRYCHVNVVVSGKESQYRSIPRQDTWAVNPNAAYLHYTSNETLSGVEFHEVPNITEVPLVSDMTSNLLGYPVDVNRFALLYAGSQKNLGIAGMSVVIIREDLLEAPSALTPLANNYQLHAQSHSLTVTPPVFAIYMFGLVCQWLKQQGGLAAIGEINRRKSAKLYRVIDEIPFYINEVDRTYRSYMNVTWRLRDATLEESFLKQAHAHDLCFLKGHSLIGGFRASLYNGVPEAAVDALVNFMREFANQHA